MMKIARTARKFLGAMYYHTIVQGINKEYIFSEERYINQYLKMINKYANELNIKIIAFCVMNNHAHFLLQPQHIEDLSRLMQKTNSNYAKYYNFIKNGRVGYVFRDRFLSEPITSQKYFVQCIKYIHLNPVKAKMVERCEDYKYSSYNHFKKFELNNTEEDLFTKDELVDICTSNECNMSFIDIDTDYKENLDNAINIFVQKENIETMKIFNDREILKKLILYLKEKEKIKYVDIMKYFEISKGTMDRLKQ